MRLSLLILLTLFGLSGQAWSAEQTFMEFCKATTKNRSEDLDCWVHKVDGLKAQLDAVYQDALAKARATDKDGKKLNMYSLMGNEAALTKSQQDFETYLASECSRRSMVSASLTGGFAKIGCEETLIRQRMDELKQ